MVRDKAEVGRAHPRAVSVALGDHLPEQLLHLKLAALRKQGEVVGGVANTGDVTSMCAPGCKLLHHLPPPPHSCPGHQPTCCVSTTTTPPPAVRLAAHSCVRMRVTWAMPRDDSQ